MPYADLERRREARRKWKRNNREAVNAMARCGKLRAKYGMDCSDYDRMLAAQGGVCAVCRQPETIRDGRAMPVDHDHVTGEVRAILCSSCNRSIGLLGEDPERLRALATYLEENRVRSAG